MIFPIPESIGNCTTQKFRQRRRHNLCAFCPESKLSGIGYTDFMPSVWYARKIVITEKELDGHILLHIGACDYKTTVYINGQKVCEHTGGYTPITTDIAPFAQAGETPDRRARAGRRALPASAARQTEQPLLFLQLRLHAHDRDLQTVWLEFVPKTYIQRVKTDATDLDGNVFFDVKLNTFLPMRNWNRDSARRQGRFKSRPSPSVAFRTNLCALYRPSIFGNRAAPRCMTCNIPSVSADRKWIPYAPISAFAE